MKFISVLKAIGVKDVKELEDNLGQFKVLQAAEKVATDKEFRKERVAQLGLSIKALGWLVG